MRKKKFHIDIASDLVVDEYASGRTVWFLDPGSTFSAASACAESVLGRERRAREAEFHEFSARCSSLSHMASSPHFEANPFLKAFREAQEKRDADR